LTPADLLAEGGESAIYELGTDRILRIGCPGVSYQIERYDLLREIEAAGLPWPLPQLIEHGRIADRHFAIETRLPGRSLDVVLAEVKGDARARALRNYADAALRIREARVERPWFGELYHEPPVHRSSWPDYLVDRGRLQISKAADEFATEVPGLDDVVAGFESDVREVEGIAPGLVHGDYFPGNVLVGDDLEITGVIDFGWSTLVGDPRLDAVCASVFLEVDRAWSTRADADLVRGHLRERAPDVEGVFDLYRTFCAIHFSFVIHYGIPLYKWCVRTLREQRA
jgi:putative membrane protein